MPYRCENIFMHLVRLLCLIYPDVRTNRKLVSEILSDMCVPGDFDPEYVPDLTRPIDEKEAIMLGYLCTLNKKWFVNPVLWQSDRSHIIKLYSDLYSPNIWSQYLWSTR